MIWKFINLNGVIYFLRIRTPTYSRYELEWWENITNGIPKLSHHLMCSVVNYDNCLTFAWLDNQCDDHEQTDSLYLPVDEYLFVAYVHTCIIQSMNIKILHEPQVNDQNNAHNFLRKIDHYYFIAFRVFHLIFSHVINLLLVFDIFSLLNLSKRSIKFQRNYLPK